MRLFGVNQLYLSDIMRAILNIAFVAVAVSLFACRDMHSVSPKSNVVAKVGDKVLTIEEINQSTPANLTGDDSLSFVKMYVDHWLVKQLKVEEASTLFSSEEEEIEQLVEDYRQSLLMRRVDQYHVEQLMSEDFSDDEIARYYNSHKSNFLLDETMVKGIIVKCNTKDKYNQLRDNIERVGSSSSSIQILEDACQKNGYTLFNHQSEWINFSDFLSDLPTSKSQNYDHILDKVGVQDLVSGNSRYYFMITSACRKGNVAPMEVVSDKIRLILITQRRADIIKQHEQTILDDAFQSGHAQVVKPII